MALLSTPPIQPNEVCPDFKLDDLWGRSWQKSDFFKGSPATLFMFICNHCPYVKAIEDRLITLAQDLKKINTETIAICANDSSSYPDDAPAALKARAEAKKYPFIYLHDADQSVAKKFGAVCTPDFFLYTRDAQLFYRGRLDDSWKDPSQVTQRELFVAAQTIVNSKSKSTTLPPLPFPMKPSMGCSIKWKS
jgi:peroxiredoxin